ELAGAGRVGRHRIRQSLAAAASTAPSPRWQSRPRSSRASRSDASPVSCWPLAGDPDELWKEAWKARDRGDFAKLKSILLSIEETHGHRVSYLVGLGLA